MRQLFAVVLAALAFAGTTTGATCQHVPEGSARIMVPAAAPDGSPMVAWTHKPKGLPADRPIVFVMHGLKRNAETYRDNWVALADKFGLLVVAPEMEERHFPGARGYNLGNMFAKDKQPQPRSLWAWGSIDRIFEHVKRATGSSGDSYAIFGHSAGAQFVHRMRLFAPASRISMAIAANAGWYTMPAFDQRFPYGLADSGLAPEQLRTALGKPLTILLGSLDNDPNHKNLRRTERANLQGPNRLERGLAFFRQAKAQSIALGVQLSWELEVAPGVAHDNAAMALRAATRIAQSMLPAKSPAKP